VCIIGDDKLRAVSQVLPAVKQAPILICAVNTLAYAVIRIMHQCPSAISLAIHIDENVEHSCNAYIHVLLTSILPYFIKTSTEKADPLLWNALA